ncbi:MULTISPECIES: penicillin-binding protein activator [unclassified Halomonas]|uniref:penicillin-binding protein activator n=1 Tax=unclassified Halomonas TaxID=2609666 RepID=UPI000D178090|nr:MULTISPECIES: penicillin-binding protein activator [unclassified Halomonas]RAH37100.1 penicillin-binding protein activator [Halomonas sp. SL1]
MKISSRGPLAAAFVAMWLAGCAFQPGITERQPVGDPNQLLAQAEQQAPEQAAKSRLRAADILARQGSRPQALEIVKDIDDSRLPPEDRGRWAMLLSDLGETEGDPSAVIQAAQQLDELQLPRDQAALLRERQARALGQIGETRAAAQTLLRLQADTGRIDLNDPIWEQLSRLTPGAIDELRDGASDPTRAWLDLAELVRTSGGDIERLFARLDDWRGRYPDHPAARQLPADILALRDLRGQDVRHIAVFLPESGPLAGVADALEEGLRAHHMNEVNGGGRGIQLTFIDSSGGNFDALYQEARQRGAQVVIGPLDKDAVTALERRDRVPMPTLALNYGEDERNSAEGLFQYGLSAEDEARSVAARGRQDGHRSASLLVPDNAWGRRVGEAFADAWRDRDGRIANAVRYNPGRPATESTRRALGSSRPDMLFLLALPDYARQVPPTIDYYAYKQELSVYATSHLYEGRPQPRLDKDLNGVMFLDIPWQIPDAAVGGEEALPFLDSYRQLREESDPNMFRLMAMGVDAYELARRLPQFQAIPGSELFGATGTLSADQDGRIHRELPWARFEDGVPQPALDMSHFTDDASR